MDHVWAVLYNTWKNDPGDVTEDLLRQCYDLQAHTQFESDRASVLAQLEESVTRSVDEHLKAEEEGSS
jgi:hypothetical protein